MKNKSIFFVVSAGILWGIISLFIKPLSAMGFSAMQIGFLRSAISFIVLLAYLLIADRSSLKIKLKDIWMFVGTGILSLALFNFCYFYAIINGQASIAVVLLYTSPVFIMLMSVPIFKERITLAKISALVLTLFGCVMVSGVMGGKLNVGADVIILGIASGLFYGLYTIFGKLALKKYSSKTVTAYTFLFAFLGMLPICNLKQTTALMSQQPKSVLLFLAAAFCCTVMPYFLYTKGLESLESGKATILVAVEPLVGAVVGTIFFNEPLNIIKGIGIVFILVAIIVLNARWGRKNILKSSE